MTDFTSLLVAGVPLVAVIFGLVEFAKKFGLSGNWLTLFSLLLGLVLGFCYKISEAGMPANFPAWFSTTIFSLALGLVASGLYDFADKRTSKIGP
jgi:lipopolysaccharide export LptBFGC system permease protein LptF